MILYLIRHGETEGNRQGRYIGWADPPLTPGGQQQAASLAQRLAGPPIRAVLSSDLSRAMETARPIAAALGLTLQPHPGLREANFGAWCGLTYEEIRQREPERIDAWLGDPERHAPPGGETLAELRQRALAALPSHGPAAVVSHGGTLRAILAHFTRRPFWDFRLATGGITVLNTRTGAIVAEEEIVSSGVSPLPGST